MQAQMLRAVLQDCLHGPGADQDALVFVRRDYLDGGADLVALAEDVLGRAQAECLS